jgi:hypothetical protein
VTIGQHKDFTSMAAWRASGHSLYRFARERGLSPNTLKRWAEAPVTSRGEPSFVRLEDCTAAWIPDPDLQSAHYQQCMSRSGCSY